MKPVIPISLKRMAVKNMQAVQQGSLSHQQARRRFAGIQPKDIVTHLTREYDRETAKAFQYFRLL
jgi:hypothetical protein